MTDHNEPVDVSIYGNVETINVTEDGSLNIEVYGEDYQDTWFPGTALPAGDNPPENAVFQPNLPTRTDTADNNYIWITSGGDSEAVYSFEAEGGNIGADFNPSTNDFWITSDQVIAGGAVAPGQSGVPGYFFDGAVERFKYSGDVSVYINGDYVPPEDVVDHLSSSTGSGSGGDGSLHNNLDDMSLTFEDHFDQASFDDNPYWGAGWGWGHGAPGAKVSRVDVPDDTNIRDHVEISNSKLILTADYDDFDTTGDVHVGAVHSRADGWSDAPSAGLTVDAPVYFEAKIKTVGGEGWQNAFWSKPANENWPPEIDVMEMLQDSGASDWTSHNVHYSTSGNCDDGSTHDFYNGSYSGYASGDGPTEAFHTYGFEWREDVLRHYVDGQVVEEITDQTILDALANSGCRPHYMMLSLNLDNVGTTDKTVSWAGKQMEVDYVRIYNP